jgi:WXXGXW repeat (2 copies)
MARGTAKAIAASACIALSAASIEEGCVVEAGASMSTGIAVTGPPPPPMREARPPPPDAQAVWVAGYWHWSGMQYTWIPGHWENAPPGASWRAPRYSLRDGTYFYEPGGWSRRP